MNDEVAAVLDDAYEKVKVKVKKYPPMIFLYCRGYLIYTCLLPVRLHKATASMSPVTPVLHSPYCTPVVTVIYAFVWNCKVCICSLAAYTHTYNTRL